ncbi:efflux RND transporter permease subunit [Wenzhouxiangella sp. XN79A]|nr:efflux RND transporter permease subunit [Wenzhouxiangella sp. XN79A]
MAGLVAGGVWSAITITKEVQPQIVLDSITVTVPYRGGTPTDVEQGVLIKIEEAIEDVEGIEEVVATAREGSGTVRIDVLTDYDVLEVLDEVKNAVDSIATFPAETERPIYNRPAFTREIIYVSVFGDVPERTLKEVARQLRNEIVALPDVAQADLLGARPYEIGIEVREETLRAYGLTLAEVASAVRASSLDLPGGRIEAAGGDILVRSVGQAYVGRDFQDIVVRSNPDGSRVLLKDVAEINDGFVESERYARHNGEPAIAIRVVSTGGQDALAASEATRRFIEERQQTLPDGVSVAWWADSAYYLKDRLSMMTKNLLAGALLVFLILTLFLRLKLAFWVMIGLLVAFAGTMLALPLVGVTINLVSLFGFLVVLGIVVDDAIVIGESSYTEIRSKGHSVENVINGTMKVAVPATFGVLTTIAAFAPILMVDGVSGQFFAPIGWVVVIALFMSLIESKLILPAHLAHMKVAPRGASRPNVLVRMQRRVSEGMHQFADRFYLPSLAVMLRNRYTALAGFVAVLIISIGFVAGPFVRVAFFPDVAGDFMRVELQMNEGTPAEITHQAMDHLSNSLARVDERMQEEFDLEQPVVRTRYMWSGSETSGNILVELHKTEDPRLNVTDIERRWREEVGQIVGARALQVGGPGGPGGNSPDISFQLVGQDIGQLESAAAELETAIRQFEGTYDLRNSYEVGLRELQIRIKPEAEVLGLSQQMLGRQVRQAFFGEEVQRIQRGEDDVRVMVRYPLEQRSSEGYLENMRIRTPSGEEVPFGAVAEIVEGTSPSAIRRYNGERSVSITARVDKDLAEPGAIITDLRQNILPRILAGHAGVDVRLSGQTQALQDIRQQLFAGTLFALFMIYALIAIPLRSYLQPLLIMSVIPFGIIGAVFGHLLLGYPVSMISIFGIVALAGVVVNDSLILVDFVNHHRKQGESRIEAALKGARARFRPIILTSATTFLGLVPIVFFEKSLQAQSVIPMAISLSFGILFATVITLALIPILYLIGDDLTGLLRRRAERRRGSGFTDGEQPTA